MSNRKTLRNARGTRPVDALMIAFVMSLAAFWTLPIASAHTSSGWVPWNTDKIYNWDYRSTSSTALSNTDWPINVIFWNNATVTTVKDNRQDIFEYNCNVAGGLCNKHHRSDNSGNGTGWGWDTDGGRKEFRCGYSGGADQWALHYRAYENDWAGSPGTHLWVPGWGYYTPVSSHFDIDDPGLPFSNCDATAHGYDESAEGWIVYYYGGQAGWQAWDDWTVHFHNAPDALRVIGGIDHWGNGDSHSSIIYVP